MIERYKVGGFTGPLLKWATPFVGNELNRLKA